MAAEYTILVTDQQLAVVGDPITCWDNLDVTLRLNEPGSGLFSVPAYDWVTAQMNPGNRIVAVRGDTAGGVWRQEVLLAGPIEKLLYERSDDGEKSGVGTWTINFADDLAKVVARQAYPNPALAVDAQTTDAWTYTGNAEVAIRTLVDVNAGPSALAARRVPGLVLGDLAGVGTTVTVNAERMPDIGPILREIADTGGGLAFRTRQVGSQILFEVYRPPDVSGQVRFSFGLGNLRYVSYETTAPTCTAVAIGGQGDGADRYMIERVNVTEQATWGRMEKLVSRAGTSSGLADDGDKELAGAAATVKVATNVSDTPDQRFGEHYGLGYKVAVETLPGEQFVDVVRTVHIQAWQSAGEYVAATVGSQAASTDPAWVARTREIDERLGQLERHVLPA